MKMQSTMIKVMSTKQKELRDTNIFDTFNEEMYLAPSFVWPRLFECVKRLESVLNESNLSMTKPNFYLKATITLDFVLTCSIKLGAAPTDAECQQEYNDDPSNPKVYKAPGIAGRKRRETEQIEFRQTTGTYDF